jgi:hypothetical protein
MILLLIFVFLSLDLFIFQVSSSLIAEDPDVGEVPHIDIDEPHHIEEKSLIIEESLPSTGSPANIPEGEYTSAAGHNF